MWNPICSVTAHLLKNLRIYFFFSFVPQNNDFLTVLYELEEGMHPPFGLASVDKGELYASFQTKAADHYMPKKMLIVDLSYLIKGEWFG